jgi:hypothetical protein
MAEKHFGRWKRKPKNLRYRNENRRFKNKMKRIRKSCGEKAASEYARRYLRGIK